MMTSRWARLTALGLGLGPAFGLAGGLASAADLLEPLPPAEFPAPVVVGEGWYLRGDFTDTHYARPKDAVLPDPNDPGLPPLVGLRLGRGEAGYGGGVGYRFNEFFRVDATIDWREGSAFRAYSSRSNFVTGYNLEAGRLDVLTGLVNVYADLGTWWGLTPYIGAGVGVADKTFRGGYTQTTCLIEACDGLAGTGPRTAAVRPNKSVTSFAWALTAGLSYEVGAGLSIDAAYRYLDLGTARSGVDAFGGATRLKALTANEFRIGLRYQFAGGASAAAPVGAYGY